MGMDLDSKYEISRTAKFILSKNFSRVALQFPDELLKDSTKVVAALRNEILSLKNSSSESTGDDKEVGLFVMADTTYGSCCIDEVAALHIDAEVVVHYGHTCLSPTSALPGFVVFGKAPIGVSKCVENLLNYASTTSKPIVVLYGLEYAHAIKSIGEALIEKSRLSSSSSKLDICCAEVMDSFIRPLQEPKESKETIEVSGNSVAIKDSVTSTRYAIGGLTWELPKGTKMEDYLLFWIGSDNSAFANVVLTFNGCDIVRYDAAEESLVTEFSQQRKILMRRYYLVEKAKDANIIGILVGTLGVAGYLHMIHQMQDLITAAGKKAYMLVMGRPNPAKLANFPECDVFIYVSCAQTALLDSKEFLAPVITPFEAMIAFNRRSQWTGKYVIEFRDLVDSSPEELEKHNEEPRFSFFRGGYVEDANAEETENCEQDTEEGEELALVQATEKALQLRDKDPNFLAKRTPKSGPEYFLTRSYQGLEMKGENISPGTYLIGRSGKASGYKDENSK